MNFEITEERDAFFAFIKNHLEEDRPNIESDDHYDRLYICQAVNHYIWKLRSEFQMTVVESDQHINKMWVLLDLLDFHGLGYESDYLSDTESEDDNEKIEQAIKEFNSYSEMYKFYKVEIVSVK